MVPSKLLRETSVSFFLVIDGEGGELALSPVVLLSQCVGVLPVPPRWLRATAMTDPLGEGGSG